MYAGTLKGKCFRDCPKIVMMVWIVSDVCLTSELHKCSTVAGKFMDVNLSSVSFTGMISISY